MTLAKATRQPWHDRCTEKVVSEDGEDVAGGALEHVKASIDERWVIQGQAAGRRFRKVVAVAKGTDELVAGGFAASRTWRNQSLGAVWPRTLSGSERVRSSKARTGHLL